MSEYHTNRDVPHKIWGVAVKIISAERAVAEGSTPDQIGFVAEWHEGRGANTHGDRSKRHSEIARQLRTVAREMEITLQAEAA